MKFAAHYSGILTGFTGKTHQVVNDIAIMRSLPNMTVLAPCDGEEARSAIRAATEYEGPVYVRLIRDPIRSVTPPDRPFKIGAAVRLRDGSDIGLIATGAQTVRALEAAELLAREGVEAALLHVPTIKPLDEGAIAEFAQGVPYVLTCEEHSIFGGLGSAVAEVLSARYPTRVERLGLMDVDGESAPNDALLEKYGLSSSLVARRAQSVLAAP